MEFANRNGGFHLAGRHPTNIVEPQRGTTLEIAAQVFSRLPIALWLLVVGCAPAAGIPEANGELDDGWDRANNPVILAENLEYHLEELPRSGSLEEPVWADEYDWLPGDAVAWAGTNWPTVLGSSNARWQGHQELSPLEKYDLAFNGAQPCEQPTVRCGPGAKEVWDAYIECAGPAASWQTAEHQDARSMFDGEDSNGDGSIDECAVSDEKGGADGVKSWEGMCHAWAPASLLEPEPRHAVVVNGVEFSISDIKALLVTIYDDSEAVSLGGRCKGKKVERDPRTGLVADDQCRDTNPGGLHVAVTNFIGIHDMALGMDRVASSEVWNHPVHAYDVSEQRPVSAASANACIGVGGDEYVINDAAEELAEVRMTLSYIDDTKPSVNRLGAEGFVKELPLHYILEIDAGGKVIGGEYCADSVDLHPDFLWGVISMGPGQRVNMHTDEVTQTRNPHVDVDTVRELLRLARSR